MKRNKLTAAIVIVLFLLAVYAVNFRQYTVCETEELQPTGIAGEMAAGHTYSQKFTCQKDGLQAVSLCLSTFARVNNSSLSVSLYQEGERIKVWDIDCRKLADNAYYPFLLDRRIRESAGREYTLEVVPNAPAGAGITAYINDGGGGFSVDQEESFGTSLCYRLQYRLGGRNAYTILGLIFIAAAVLILWTAGRRYFDVKRQFLILWTAFSLMFLCSSPLFNVPDEVGHFFRSFEIAQGHPVSVLYEEEYFVGRDLPINTDLNVFKEDWQSFRENSAMTESGDSARMERSFYNTALYSPVTYLPQAAGIAAARVFTDRIALIAYSGRIFNWLCITLLLCIALELLPCGKEFLALIALMPMNIQESVSLAPDGLVVALAAVMTALTMRLRCGGGPAQLKKSHLLCLYALAVLLSMNKIVYLPFCLLYLLIPAEKFGGMKKKVLHAAAMAVLVVSLNLWWLQMCSGFLITQGVDSQRQIMYILKYPLQYGITMLETLLSQLSGWLQGMVGSSLAWMDVTIPGILVLAYLCAIVKKLEIRFTEADKNRRIQRNLLLFMVFAILVLICTSLYVQWTPLYEPYIGGIQGRYFIALLLPLYFAFHWPGHADDRAKAVDHLRLCEVSLIILIDVCACICLLFSSIRQG